MAPTFSLTNATVNAGKLNFSATSGTVTLSSLSGPGSTNFAAGANVGGTFSRGTATVAGVGTFKIVSGGTVNLNGAGGNITTVSGGIVNANGTNESITTLNGGTLNLGSGDTTTVTNGTDTGTISGTGNLVKGGGSTDVLTLSASNGFTGTTAINGGVLSVNDPNALAGTTAISFGGGTLQYTSNNTHDYSNIFSNAASQPISIDSNGQSVTFASALTSSGGSLTKLSLAGTPGSYQRRQQLRWRPVRAERHAPDRHRQ